MRKIRLLVTLGTFLFGLAGCSNAEDEIVETTEPEEVKVEEKEEEAEPVESSGITELSDDLYSFQVRINSEVYQFPMSFDTFEELGLEYQGDPTETLDASSCTVAQYAVFDDFEVFVDVINFAPETRPVNECYIGGMTFDTCSLNDTDVAQPLEARKMRMIY